MMTTQNMPAAANNDAELVKETLTGNREAFSLIVSRYQSLICSLAYSATGSLGQSEDLAQETFITAWKHLGHLRERHKLRAWLCGIARNRINNFLRREGREPLRRAEPLDDIAESHAPEPLPGEQTIRNEEQAILWRSLERIPEIYREPLILFYREHQSIAAVAQSLDLTEGTAKQRLSRGRKLLHEQVLALVEDALERTNPGTTFTLGVMGALPVLGATAKATTIAAAAAKGGAMAKTGGLVWLWKIVPTPILALVGTYYGYKLDMNDARSPQRHRLIATYYRLIFSGVGLIFFTALILTLGGYSRMVIYLVPLAGMAAACCIFWFLGTLRNIRRQEIAENRPMPALVPVYEYQSKASLLGLPLVHIRIRGGLERGPVKAWIAVGDAAIGVVFALGAVAIAPISFGGFAMGLLSLGGFAIGAVALGGFSLAIGAFGVMASGWQAYGMVALAWDAAQGHLAMAHYFALGDIAQAEQANNTAAESYIQAAPLFRQAQSIICHMNWLYLLWLLPIFLWWRTVTLKRRAKLH